MLITNKTILIGKL